MTSLSRSSGGQTGDAGLSGPPSRCQHGCAALRRVQGRIESLSVLVCWGRHNKTPHSLGASATAAHGPTAVESGSPKGGAGRRGPFGGRDERVCSRPPSSACRWPSSPILHITFPLSTPVSASSSSCEDTSHTGLGQTLTTSFQLNGLSKIPWPNKVTF